jgi:hypothetical protein
MIKERIEPFVRILREAHPDVPIILVESILSRSLPSVGLLSDETPQNVKNAALRCAFERLRDTGDTNLHYLPGRDLLGDDFEGTVDGVHPTGTGFLRMADAIGAALVADRADPPAAP